MNFLYDKCHIVLLFSLCFVVTHYDLSTDRSVGMGGNGSKYLLEWVGMDSNCRETGGDGTEILSRADL